MRMPLLPNHNALYAGLAISIDKEQLRGPGYPQVCRQADAVCGLRSVESVTPLRSIAIPADRFAS